MKIKEINMSCSQPTRLLCPWDFPSKDTGVGYCFPLQVIFPTQGSNLGLLHCRQTLPSEPPGKPKYVLEIILYIQLYLL